ncbi:MAG: hypothetical protein R3C97_19485 [Geminicoccaceae bacterium]
MSDSSNHSGLSPRAFVLLAHHVEAGRCVADAAQITGVDPALAEHLAQCWMFRLLMWLVPFFRVHVGQSSTSREGTAPSRLRSPLPPAPRRAFSLHIRCDSSKAADDATSHDDGETVDEAVTGGIIGGVNGFAGRCPRSRKHVAGQTESGSVTALCRLSSQALFAPLVKKIA